MYRRDEDSTSRMARARVPSSYYRRREGAGDTAHAGQMEVLNRAGGAIKGGMAGFKTGGLKGAALGAFLGFLKNKKKKKKGDEESEERSLPSYLGGN